MLAMPQSKVLKAMRCVCKKSLKSLKILALLFIMQAAAYLNRLCKTEKAKLRVVLEARRWKLSALANAKTQAEAESEVRDSSPC